MVGSSRKACLLIKIFPIPSPFLLPSFLGWKRKGKKSNQSRGEKSCLSARSFGCTSTSATNKYIFRNKSVMRRTSFWIHHNFYVLYTSCIVFGVMLTLGHSLCVMLWRDVYTKSCVMCPLYVSPSLSISLALSLSLSLWRISGCFRLVYIRFVVAGCSPHFLG